MKWLKFIVIFLLTIVSIILYARFISTKGFNTKEYTIYNSELPKTFDGVKVVHFSDIHYNRAINSSKVDKIVEEINLINPDIVIFTGDLIDKDVDLSSKDYEYLTDAFSRINAKYGKYSVLGNHDYSNKEKVINIYNDSDFVYLENSYDILYNEHNDKIFIGGIGNVSYNLDDVDELFKDISNVKDISYKIILAHEPDISDKILDSSNVSLILAGHSHNGQIRLPFIGALYTPPHAKKYYEEYYNVKDTDIYISSGIGVSSINYRFFNRPSINFYRINKKEEI